MTITLPIPSKLLSPNGRGHWAKKARATKHARSSAYWQAIQQIRELEHVAQPSRYRLRFYHAQQRKRDEDNASASCKAYRDGIADAFQMDDHGLRLDGDPEFLIDRENPRLEIELS